jgi:hypothetical protein
VVCLGWYCVVKGGTKEGRAMASLPKQRGETKKGKQGPAWGRHVEKKRRWGGGPVVRGRQWGSGGEVASGSDGDGW